MSRPYLQALQASSPSGGRSLACDFAVMLCICELVAALKLLPARLRTCDELSLNDPPLAVSFAGVAG